MAMWNAFDNGKYFPLIETPLALKDFALETEEHISPMVVETLIPLANMMHYINNDQVDVSNIYLKYINNSDDTGGHGVDPCSYSKCRKIRTMSNHH